MATELTQLTAKEIENYRSQLAGNSKALADLDLIEEFKGDLQKAARVLARRAVEEEKSDLTWESILKQARQVVCDEKFKESLAPDLIGGVIGALIASSNPLLIAVATPCASYIVKVSLAEFCKTPSSEPE